MDLRNRKVTVIGLGASGFEASYLLLKEGAIVSVTDKTDDANVRQSAKLLKEKCVETEVGCHTEDFLEGTELAVVSPGVENSSLPIRYAGQNGIPIISELELAYPFCKGTIVAVTGTNGKSTVVSLLGEVLREGNVPHVVCGNIGNPFSGEIQHIDRDTVVILEVSSFQLERIESFRPKIAVILNITPDHLDRYKSFGEYRDFKARIFENQKESDTVVLNYGDRNVRELADSRKIVSRVLYFNNMDSRFRGNDRGTRGNDKLCGDDKFHVNTKLRGRHNEENIMASSAVAELLGIEGAAFRQAIENFKPLKHRFERVATIGGIEFIDDSKATNVDSTYRALSSLERPTILIAGGRDKNLAYEKILPVLAKGVKKIVLIGEARKKMRDIFGEFVAVEEGDSLEAAVLAAYKSASSGDSVLLSPMCSSFDMFRDYKHRGEVFRKAVQGLCGR